MSRFWIRLFTEFVTPLILGSLIVAFSGIFGPSIEGFRNFIFILIVSTVFMGIQSIAYSLLMEWLAALLKKRRADMGFLVIVSLILGGLAGSKLIFLTPKFVYTGLAVGAVCGLI